MLEREGVDLILTDLSMPVLDGYRTTQLIRARPALSERTDSGRHSLCTE